MPLGRDIWAFVHHPLALVEYDKFAKGGEGKAILCLDMGRDTGMALLHRDGTVGHDLLKFPKTVHPGQSYNLFRLALTRINKSAGGIDQVVYEEKTYNRTSLQNARVAFSFEGNLLSWCALHKIPTFGVHNQRLKKFITGKGRADKEQMIFMVRQMGFNPQDHNVADAIALLTYYLETSYARRPDIEAGKG